MMTPGTSWCCMLTVKALRKQLKQYGPETVVVLDTGHNLGVEFWRVGGSAYVVMRKEATHGLR